MYTELFYLDNSIKQIFNYDRFLQDLYQNNSYTYFHMKIVNVYLKIYIVYIYIQLYIDIIIYIDMAMNNFYLY